MTHRFAISATAVLLAAIECAACQSITINGVFVDSRTGGGISSARVELYQRQWGFPLPAERLVATTTTDKKGRFRFIGSWRGTFDVYCVSTTRKALGSQELRDGQHDVRIYAGVLN
jgi:hypothetical protein